MQTNCSEIWVVLCAGSDPKRRALGFVKTFRLCNEQVMGFLVAHRWARQQRKTQARLMVMRSPCGARRYRSIVHNMGPDPTMYKRHVGVALVALRPLAFTNFQTSRPWKKKRGKPVVRCDRDRTLGKAWHRRHLPNFIRHIPRAAVHTVVSSVDLFLRKAQVWPLHFLGSLEKVCAVELLA